MIFTVSYYRAAKVVDGVPLQLVGEKISSESRTTDGAFAAAPDEARICRIATDTKMHFDVGAAVTSADDFLPANAIDYIGVHEGQIIAILTAV